MALEGNQVFEHVSTQGQFDICNTVPCNAEYVISFTPPHLSLCECEMEAMMFLLPVPCDPEGTRVGVTFSMSVVTCIRLWRPVTGVCRQLGC